MPDTPDTAAALPTAAGRRVPAGLRRFLSWAAVLLWAGVIFRFSALPGSEIPARFSEVGHFSEYAMLGALLYLALRTDLDRGTALAVAIITASVYGGTDEFHQHFVVMRTPDVADWGMDTIGAMFGGLAAIAIEAGARRFWGRRAAASAVGADAADSDTVGNAAD